ncbi:hypothetical protein BHE97_05600 [Aeromicrobium sp. PE09-221]|uniref:HNH endonuclease signature motif containing protein n=1 Tax=Aeromicrobium sp. PE09-221 TaxID=1898043 RepID=UPI000B3E85AB|nr:HNH endonuclease signature motif containing protein [Aeromicrobium sp. PE09-221]OUZ11309.1 hypothetical protein BHE97_05600 [Aeromicrobium sp. PE09-221]
MSVVVDRLAGGPAAIAAARAQLVELDAAELVEAHRVGQSILREVQAFLLAVTAEGSRQKAHEQTSAPSMDALIAETSGITRRDAVRQRQLAERLETAPVLAEQLTKPGMSTDKAHVVARAMDDLPRDLSTADRGVVERDLAEAAPGMSLEQLRRKARRAVEIVDKPRADTIEDRTLTRQEQTARRKASFWMTRPDDDGMVKGGFEIDAFTGDILRSVLESKTSPRYRGTPDSQGPETALVDEVVDQPSYPEKLGRAFCDVLRHLPKDGYGNHGGVAATLMVTVTEDALRGRTDQAGVTDHGTHISAGQLRMIACEAGILPVIMGGDSVPLDLGRSGRLHTEKQRRALALRDGGCAFPGCDRPSSWCEAHHVRPWSEGGPTSVDDGVLLCAHHHHKIHHSRWRVVINPRDRLPDFHPPGSTAPTRNTRYRPLVA